MPAVRHRQMGSTRIAGTGAAEHVSALFKERDRLRCRLPGDRRPRHGCQSRRRHRVRPHLRPARRVLRRRGPLPQHAHRRRRAAHPGTGQAATDARDNHRFSRRCVHLRGLPRRHQAGSNRPPAGRRRPLRRAGSPAAARGQTPRGPRRRRSLLLERAVTCEIPQRPRGSAGPPRERRRPRPARARAVPRWHRRPRSGPATRVPAWGRA